MNLLDIVMYFSIAAAAGAINSVAGGGTFFTFPVLILHGISSIQANIVSTIALWPGSVASAYAYYGQIAKDADELVRFKRFLRKSMIVSIIGSAIGTALLLSTPERTFSAMVPWLLFTATLIFTFGRQMIRGLDVFSSHISPARRVAAEIFQFLIAIYGGYFGAGIGILMLAMLQVIGLSHIHQMNALKTILGSTINAVAWVVFALSGKVLWSVALIMIAGAVMGGYVGARLAVHVPPEKVRFLVSAIGFAMTGYFFLHGV
jgi:uncharacterized membrane protein YfcA